MAHHDLEAELRRRERWEHLLDAEKGEQIEAMREWFLENYDNPAERTPYESSEGACPALSVAVTGEPSSSW